MAISKIKSSRLVRFTTPPFLLTWKFKVRWASIEPASPSTRHGVGETIADRNKRSKDHSALENGPNADGPTSAEAMERERVGSRGIKLVGSQPLDSSQKDSVLDILEIRRRNRAAPPTRGDAGGPRPRPRLYPRCCDNNEGRRLRLGRLTWFVGLYRSIWWLGLKWIGVALGFHSPVCQEGFGGEGG